MALMFRTSFFMKASLRYHRNLKSRSIIKPWKVKKVRRGSAQGISVLSYTYVYCAMENCDEKNQFMK
jgi:hypothetical protein